MPDVSSETLFDDNIRGVVQQYGNGFNSTVFAYGQTGSGKTYTMMGDVNGPGVIEVAAREIFNIVQEQAEHREYLIRLSYMEVRRHLKGLTDKWLCSR